MYKSGGSLRYVRYECYCKGHVMPRFTIKRYEQILTQMVATVVSRTRLSDIADSSVWKHVLAASARSDDELYYQMTLLLKLFSIDTAKDDDLDERAKEIQPGLISREVATKATGNVVISRAGTTGTLAIPSNTKVKTSDGVVFVTTAAGSITATSPEQIAGHGVGRDSGLIPAIAETAGADGNVVANTIVKFVSKPTGVNAVTNPSAFANGANKETDDSFLNRIKTYVSTLARGTNEALEFVVLGVEDTTTGAKIKFSKVVEDIVNLGNVVVYIDDGTGSAESYEVVSSENVTLGLAGPPADSAVGGETYLFLDYKPVRDTSTFTLTSSTRGVLTRDTHFFLNPASGQINFDPALSAGEVITADYTRFTGLIAEAQKVIDGDLNDRTNYPGYRAAGVLVQVLTPQVLVQNITVNVVVKEGYDQTETKTSVKNAIRDFVNTLGISGDMLVSDLVYAAKSVAGVYNATVVTPTSDIILLDDQLARTTDANITIA